MMTKWGKTVIVALMLAMGLVTVCLIACNSGQKSSPQTTKEKSADEQAAAKEDDDKTTSEEKATTAGQQDNKAKPSGPQPKIQFAETVFDWGTVYQQEKVIHVFKFRNTGKADLNIGNVKSG